MVHFFKSPKVVVRSLTTFAVLFGLTILVLVNPDASYGSLLEDTPLPPIIGQHTVQPGETIYCLGRAYGVSPNAIAEINNIDAFALLSPGQILSVPAVQWINITLGPVCVAQFNSPFPPLPTALNTSLTSSATATASAVSLGSHVIQRGETVYCIGRAYGVWPAAIIRANGLKSPYRLYPSHVLIIPGIRWVSIPPGPICKAQFQSPFLNMTVTPTQAITPVEPTVTPTFTQSFTPTRGGPTKTPIPTRTGPPKP